MVCQCAGKPLRVKAATGGGLTLELPGPPCFRYVVEFVARLQEPVDHEQNEPLLAPSGPA